MGKILVKKLRENIVLILLFSLIIIVAMLLIILSGNNPLLACKIIFENFSNIGTIGEVFVEAIVLSLTGLSFSFALQANLFNIGSEGQLYMGGLLAAFFAIYLKGLPMVIHLPLTLMAAFFGGGLWGLLSGWMKIKFNVSEIITTIMLNYIAIYWVNYMVTGPMMAPTGTLPQSEQIPISAKLSIILPGTRVHFGLILAILCIIIYYIYFWKTKIGYETKIVGRNIKIATYSGMEARKIIPFSMFMAGGMAGLAGGCIILGIQGRLLQNFSPGYGYDGIAIAWMGNGLPLGILFASIFFGFLRKSGNILQMFLGVPVTIIYIIEGISIIFIIFAQQLNKRKYKN